MLHFLVNQLKHELDVPASVIKKVYDNIIKQEQSQQQYDNTTNFDGEITISTPTYLEWVEKINEVFPLFKINAPTYYIHFDDSYVENALVTNGFGDGTGITLTDIQTKSFEQIFRNNTNIESFNELTYFTKINRQGFSERAFEGCSSLTSVDVSNVENFGHELVFKDCINLDKFHGASSELGVLNLTNYINSTLPASTFENCKKITEIRSLGNTTTIGRNCFNNCTNLETISQDVLNNITIIKSNAFRLCNNLLINDLSLPNLGQIDPTEETFTGTQIKKVSNLGNITIVYGFNNCKSLTEVNLPSTCIELGRRAFYNCSALTTINLQYVEKFEGSALSGCTSLEYFMGPDSERGIIDLPNLKYGDFGCSGTKVREIRNIGSVKKLASWGFIGCSLLNNIDNILPQIEEIGSMCFWRCPSLSINDLNCPNLKTMDVSVFPDIKIKKISSLGSLTVLQREMFKNCTMLTEAVLPTTLTQIDDNVFGGCTALESLTILATDPPALTVSALSNTTCTIYVPAGSVDTYKQAEGWSTYADRIQAIQTT